MQPSNAFVIVFHTKHSSVFSQWLPNKFLAVSFMLALTCNFQWHQWKGAILIQLQCVSFCPCKAIHNNYPGSLTYHFCLWYLHCFWRPVVLEEGWRQYFLPLTRPRHKTTPQEDQHWEKKCVYQISASTFRPLYPSQCMWTNMHKGFAFAPGLNLVNTGYLGVSLWAQHQANWMAVTMILPACLTIERKVYLVKKLSSKSFALLLKMLINETAAFYNLP